MRLTEKKSQNDDSQSVHVKNPLPIFGFALIILIAVGALMFFIDMNTNDMRTGKSRVDSNPSEGVASRIQPIAKFTLQVADLGDTPLKTGKEVYEATCTTCHAAGVAGAPIFGDKDAWAPYIKAGYEELLNVALHGKGAMPAKGGNTALKDLEVERAMVYMANAGGADYAEPSEDGEAAPATDTAKDDSEKAPAADVTKTETADVPPLAEQKDTTKAETTAKTATDTTGAFAATEEQLATGKKIYDAACVACHSSGVAGAPKFGDQADWAPYLETGMDTMLEIAIAGKGAMPPRGTAMNASDDELRDTILYMIQDALPTETAKAEATEPAPAAPVAEEPTDAKTDTEADTKAEPAAEAATDDAAGIPAATEEQLAIGKKIYDSACVACHSTGVAGAPKFGDKETWAPYIETGLDTMLQISISGIGAMPPRGTAMNASDEDLRATILYMIQDAR